MTDRSDRIWLPLSTARCSPKACNVRMRCATGMASIPPGAPLQDYSLEPAGGTALCPGFLTLEKARQMRDESTRQTQGARPWPSGE